MNSSQLEVFRECIAKGSGGLAAKVGFGKTLIALNLCEYYFNKTKKTCLVVMSKSLLGSWVAEINKFYPDDTLKYQILHRDHVKNFVVDTDTKILLTTCDVVSKVYTYCEIKDKFVYIERITHAGGHGQLTHEVVNYNRVNSPLLNDFEGEGVLYGKNWGCLMVDEIQKFTNISSKRCTGLASICAQYRWGLSGTMFDEPKIERILELETSGA